MNPPVLQFYPDALDADMDVSKIIQIGKHYHTEIHRLYNEIRRQQSIPGYDIKAVNRMIRKYDKLQLLYKDFLPIIHSYKGHI